MEDTKKLIEKYKRELMEMSRNAPPSAQAGRPAETRPAESRSEESRPESGSQTEESTIENRPAEEKPAKSPRVIGYVTEDSGDFHSVFDKFITEAVEKNEIETVRTEDPDYLNMPDGTDVPDGEPNEMNNSMNMPAELPGDSLDNSDRPNPEEDMDQGTGESIASFPVSEYSTLSEFEARNNCVGTLQFWVFTASEALPIENAAVVVTSRINGRDHEMFSAVTDSSGETGAHTLPAPSKELSQSSKNSVQPFALYDASVAKEGYAKVILRDIPIFDGVQSIQRVAMIPELEFTAANSPDEEITEVRDAD